MISNWNEITEKNGAYDLRNVLVHGVQGTTGLNYAATRVEQLLDASNDLIKFCNSHNFDIYTRLPTGKSKNLHFRLSIIILNKIYCRSRQFKKFTIPSNNSLCVILE